jgi:hypothetical protein
MKLVAQSGKKRPADEQDHPAAIKTMIATR